MYAGRVKNSSSVLSEIILENISDANENVRIVEGEGVIGEKPIMKPNTSFEYNSLSSFNV